MFTRRVMTHCSFYNGKAVLNSFMIATVFFFSFSFFLPGTSSTYVRWGRTICNTYNGTDLVYKGL